MPHPIYKQQQISVPQQIALLKSQGLTFRNQAKAEHLLTHISLFRLKGYLFPFRQENRKDFKPGATFEKAYSLYKFDAELRKLVFSQLEKIEVSLRTQLSLIITDYYGEYWFQDAGRFTDPQFHAKLLKSLKHELDRSDDDVLVKFFANYSNPFPPSWMTLEASSFGTLSLLYKGLKPGKARREVANYYGLSDTIMISWIHALVHLRNICAHHGRLWNRQLAINAQSPRVTNQPFINIPADTKRAYYIFSIILFFLQTVNPNHTFVIHFKNLLKKYPNIDLTAMGFPENWQKEPLWQSIESKCWLKRLFHK